MIKTRPADLSYIIMIALSRLDGLQRSSGHSFWWANLILQRKAGTVGLFVCGAFFLTAFFLKMQRNIFPFPFQACFPMRRKKKYPWARGGVQLWGCMYRAFFPDCLICPLLDTRDFIPGLRVYPGCLDGLKGWRWWIVYWQIQDRRFDEWEDREHTHRVRPSCFASLLWSRIHLSIMSVSHLSTRKKRGTQPSQQVAIFGSL